MPAAIPRMEEVRERMLVMTFVLVSAAPAATGKGADFCVVRDVLGDDRGDEERALFGGGERHCVRRGW